MKKAVKIIGVILVLAILCGFVLGGCFIYKMVVRPEFSDEFTLTEEDYEKFEKDARKYKESILEDKNDIAILVNSLNFIESFYFIDAQHTIAYINYCKDMKDEELLRNYEFAFEMYSKTKELYSNTIKDLLLSDSETAKEMFSEWTDEEKEMLLSNNEKVFDLNLENQHLFVEYRNLDAEADNWAEEVDKLYLQVVKNNNKIAAEYDCRNYYEYVSPYHHLRSYTEEDRETFRSYVKKYIAPLCGEVHARLDALKKNADKETLEAYTALANDSYNKNEDVRRYIAEYIDGFYKKPGDGYEDLGECMKRMLEDDLAIFSSGENALDGAFTTYIPYFETPVAFFGKGYQNMLTVVHEAGHFAVFDRFDSINLPLDFCEVHSQANEWMFIAYLEDELDPEVYELIKLSRLAVGLRTIIISTMVDECEEKVYSSVTEDTTAEQLSGIITGVISAYGEYFTEVSQLESYFRHVAVEDPAYYLSYALSEVVSLTSFIEAEDDLAAAQRAYLKFVDDSIDTDTIIGGLKDAFDESTFENIVDAFSVESDDDGSAPLDDENAYAPAA